MILTGCPDAPESFDYQFKLPFEISPQKDTLHVGDTLWLKAENSDVMDDFKSNKSVEFKEGNFMFPFSLFEIQKGSQQIHPDYNGALNLFGYFAKIGDYELFDEITIRIKPEYKDHTYKVHLAIIPLKPGLYFLFSGNDDIYKGLTGNEIKKAVTIQNFAVPSIKDYLLGSGYESLNSEYIRPTIKEYGKCFYFFYVKEK